MAISSRAGGVGRPGRMLEKVRMAINLVEVVVGKDREGKNKTKDGI